ncbi:TetR family transcriptional regulator [Hoyosella sp. G463]|uniref:TetR family transcriptional regulator n=1 Tax=Lolliginicoccus lacisalsi TaxID=2742202 RepID=A0A927JBG6_9ACTN|nr:TetR/AcrR family transcriptional regulator [Lolliginicoccus lacisalsi]MBD8506229.1 TetR family transcriptional regulator [Lolliginicoccus lacisalsi]
MSPTTHREPGLRQRKKAEAMRRIQHAALDLFEEQGYQNVTIEQIARAAETSPSSVYRYFGTKEQLVLHDDYDPQLLAFLAAAPGTVVEALEAMRAGMAAIMAGWESGEVDDIARRLRVMLNEDSVHAAMTLQMAEFESLIRSALDARGAAGGAGLRTRMIAAMVVAGLVAAIRHWADTGYDDRLAELLDEAMATIIRAVRAIEG